MQAPSLSYVDTVYSADALEFSPHHPRIFVVGTYQLEPSAPEPAPVQQTSVLGADSDDEVEMITPPAKRKGRLLVYEADAVEGTMKELQRIEGPAILDLKWNPRLDLEYGSILALSDAEGRVVTYAWNETLNQLENLQTLQITDPKTLVLSLDWSNRIHADDPGSLITSLSSGELTLLTPSPTSSQPNNPSASNLSVTKTWQAHDFEPWVASFDGWKKDLVYSGGDDCTFKGWDISGDCEEPLWVNRKSFDAGITCLQTSPHTPNLLAVGSYNSTLHYFAPHTSPPLRPLFADPVDIGGGAWRIKWHPDVKRKDDVLVACMHDGFKVVTVVREGAGEEGEEEERKGKVVGGDVRVRFEGHESLAYGCDWSREVTPLKAAEDGEKGLSGTTLVGSCSFYDHALHLWKA